MPFMMWLQQACMQSGFEPTVAYKSSLWDLIGEMVATKVRNFVNS